MKNEVESNGRFERSGIEAALDRAYLRALEVGRRTNTPVWVMVDGQMVDALAEERAAKEKAAPKSESEHRKAS